MRAQYRAEGIAAYAGTTGVPLLLVCVPGVDDDRLIPLRCDVRLQYP